MKTVTTNDVCKERVIWKVHVKVIISVQFELSYLNVGSRTVIQPSSYGASRNFSDRLEYIGLGFQPA